MKLAFLAFMSLGLMATCSYNREADGRQSLSGGLEYELPASHGYSK